MTRISSHIQRISLWLVGCVGTVLPIVIVVSFFFSIGSSAATNLTWQRPTIYAITAVSLLLGIIGLVRMCRQPLGEHPSVFMITMIYQKVTLDIIYWVLTLNTINLLYPRLWEVPEWITWGLFIGCSITICVVNLLLFFGPKRGWMDQESDPVPGRALWRYVANRGHRR